MPGHYNIPSMLEEQHAPRHEHREPFTRQDFERLAARQVGLQTLLFPVVLRRTQNLGENAGSIEGRSVGATTDINGIRA